jgi:hypothetical protein
MLYGEIDRLSTAWASLDEQNASKVFNLASLEDKIQRLNADVRPPLPSSLLVVLTLSSSSIPTRRKPKPTTATLRRCARRTPSRVRTRC